MVHACFSVDVSITEAQELFEVQPRGISIYQFRKKQTFIKKTKTNQ